MRKKPYGSSIWDKEVLKIMSLNVVTASLLKTAVQ